MERDPFMTPLVSCAVRVDGDLVSVTPGRDRWRRSRVRELGVEHLFEPARGTGRGRGAELRAYGGDGRLLGER